MFGWWDSFYVYASFSLLSSVVVFSTSDTNIKTYYYYIPNQLNLSQVKELEQKARREVTESCFIDFAELFHSIHFSTVPLREKPCVR